MFIFLSSVDRTCNWRTVKIEYRQLLKLERSDKKRADIESSNTNVSEQLLLGELAIFKMIQENKCQDGEALSSKTMIKIENDVQTLHDEIGHKTSP